MTCKKCKGKRKCNCKKYRNTGRKTMATKRGKSAGKRTAMKSKRNKKY